MSFDFYIEIDTGGPERAAVEYIGNYTYNVSPMFNLALGVGIRSLHEMRAEECIEVLERGVSHISDPANRRQYEELEPSNGWGDREGASDCLKSILSACRKHPKAVFVVS